jgi:hypothetical protein
LTFLKTLRHQPFGAAKCKSRQFNRDGAQHPGMALGPPARPGRGTADTLLLGPAPADSRAGRLAPVDNPVQMDTPAESDNPVQMDIPAGADTQVDTRGNSDTQVDTPGDSGSRARTGIPGESDTQGELGRDWGMVGKGAAARCWAGKAAAATCWASPCWAGNGADHPKTRMRRMTAGGIQP